MSSQLGPERLPDSNASALLERARAAAARCGVTRLADVTGLDRLGLPVWQAVRPAGRSLSVHQGKGASAETARIGALCEAIEAHCAEQARPDGPLCGFSELAPGERAPELGDYCRLRHARPDAAERIRWCRATDLLTGAACWLPHDLVSIDYTRALPNLFERVSSGLGAGGEEADALAISLLEVIERDAIGEWQRQDAGPRLATSISLPTISFDWFRAWCERFVSLEIRLDVFHVHSIVGVPVFMCVIGGVEEFGPAYRRFYGSAAHGDPEVALFKALAEAIQSRLTLIAGVRDDIMPSYYAQPRAKPAEAPLGHLSWCEAEPRPCRAEWLAERLAEAGYRQVAVKRLDEGLTGIAVTKAFVPGLGSSSRTRRVVP